MTLTPPVRLQDYNLTVLSIATMIKLDYIRYLFLVLTSRTHVPAM
jgi:hypothetical protein